MNTKEIRKQLKKAQPSLLRQYLIPKLWFKEDDKQTEYWIFYYAFFYRFSDDMISQRLGYYQPKQIYNITLKIIENNYTEITNYLRS